jgi:hypothetical protein
MTENKFKNFKENCMEMLEDNIYINKNNLQLEYINASNRLVGDIIAVSMINNILSWYKYKGKQEFEYFNYFDSDNVNAKKENVKVIYDDNTNTIFAILLDKNGDEIYRTTEINVSDYNVKISFFNEKGINIKYEW